MAGFLENYEDVAARIKRLWETHPSARVQNNIIEFNAEKGFILVQTEIFKEYEDEKPSAVDYAFGNVATYNVQMKKFFVEDTVTSSIGRAIGLLLGTDKRPTRQDMEKVETISTAVAKSTADDYDPWAKKFGDVPSFKTPGEAEMAGTPSFGSSADGVTLRDAIAEIDGQLGGQLVEEAPKCNHGHRVWKTGKKKNGDDWAGYFCPEREKANQCQPQWYMFGSNGKWRAQ